MPISKATLLSSTQAYAPVFDGEIDHSAQIPINVTALTTAEVDSAGYLKPGVPFAKDGTTVGATDTVFGVSIEPIKVATGNSAGALSAASAAFEIGLGIAGVVKKALAETNLGRSYTADEIAGFAKAGCQITLL